ncbi:MAG: T9SS type A sorting domain-containing protein [Candidatus Hatepunaea meridiana]|nr:T9SS type A sorting domain-containing protein [Candidatus Hatepunaea meridiana]
MFLLILFIVLLPTISMAQTEVEGAVSGEWTVDGSPYILVDTTWVPEDEELTIEPGVTVQICRGTTLFIYGDLTAIGTEEDSIHIEVTQIQWDGWIFAVVVDLENDENDCDLAYIKMVDVPNHGFNLIQGIINIENSTLQGARTSFRRIRSNGVAGFNASNCIFEDTDVFWGDWFIRISINRCRLINTLCWADYSLVEITECQDTSSYIMGYRSDVSIIDSDFKRLDFHECRVEVRGCNISADRFGRSIILSSCMDYIIEDNIIARCIGIGSFSNGIIRGNHCGSIYFSGIRPNFSNEAEDNYVDRSIRYSGLADEEVGHGSGGPLTIRNNYMAKLDIDRIVGYESHIESNHIIKSEADSGSYIRNSDNIMFRDNLVVCSRLNISGGHNNLNNNIDVLNNTFDLTDGSITIDCECEVRLVNNIFLYASSMSRPITTRYNNIIAEYNCFYGVTPPDDLDESNICEDPFFCGGHPFDFNLMANSPCIDAGSPREDRDLDGSRSDIGVFRFDHRIDHNPVIYSAPFDYATRGGEYRYVVLACDDGDDLDIELLDNPDWLRVANGRDFVADSIVVRGEVPDDQNDFSFLVRVTDESDQIDTQRVDVQISPYTLLRGELEGELSADGGPYLIIEPVTVPIDAELTIEPGTTVLVRQGPYWRRYNCRSYVDINVFGRLTMLGTEDDSITFASELCFEENEDPIDIEDWYSYGIYLRPGSDTCRVAYSNLKHFFSYAIKADNTVLLVENSLFTENNSSHIVAYNGSRLECRNCYFDNNWNDNDPLENTSWSIKYTASDFYVENCVFSGPGEYNDYHPSGICTYGYLNRGNECEAVIRDCIFTGMGSGLNVSHTLTFTLERCLFYRNQVGVETSHSPRADIHNCTFYRNRSHIKLTIWNDEEEMGPGPVDIRNCIFSGREVPAVKLLTTYPTYELAYSSYDGIAVEHPIDGVIEPGPGCIDANPRFVNQDENDFHLDWNSPCVNAGDPASPLDPDSTRVDMGVFYRDRSEYCGDQSSRAPDEFRLYDPFPNPFNSVFRLAFDLASNSSIEISVYDIQGRSVWSSSRDRMDAGRYEVFVNAENWVSGGYFVHFKASDYKKYTRVMLIK